ncbi:MAG: hypothetical protein AAFV33_23195 [Chloroflexota bacterium]
MTEQPERPMTRDEIKEFIFDDLMEFLEATGETNAVTPDEIATLIDEEPSRVKGAMMQLVSENVLEKFKDDGDLYFRFAEDTLEALLEEMYESGWTPPEDA